VREEDEVIMAFELKLDKSNRIIITRLLGELTDDDTISHVVKVSELFKQGVLDSTWSQLLDFSGVSEMNLSSSTISRIAEENPWPEESLRVFVVPREIQYGLARMYQIMGDPKTENVVLVKSHSEAIDHIMSVKGRKDDGIPFRG
jgi:hypothetical protein